MKEPFGKISTRQWMKVCAVRMVPGASKAMAQRAAGIPHAVFYRYLNFIEEQYGSWFNGDLRRNKHVKRHELWMAAQEQAEGNAVNMLLSTSSGAQWWLQHNFDHYKDEQYKAIDWLRLGVYLGRGLISIEEIAEELGERVVDQLRRGRTSVLLESSFSEPEDS